MLQYGNTKKIHWLWGFSIVAVVGVINILFTRVAWIELLWMGTVLSVVLWDLEYGFKATVIGQLFTTIFMVIVEWSTGDLQSFDYLSLMLVIVFYNVIFTLVVGYAFARIRTLLHQVNEYAVRDPLTQLYNRRMLEEISQSQLALAKRKRSTMGILALDLDLFKRVNDQYGHEVGDCVLLSFSKLMLSSVREMDHCFRLGGEEFLALLPDVNAGSAIDIAERIRKRVSDGPMIIGEHHINITVSIGVYLSNEWDTDFVGMIKNADEALYRSKETGRNKVTVFSGMSIT